MIGELCGDCSERKKRLPLWIFVIPIVLLFCPGILLIKLYPLLIAVLLISLVAVVLLCSSFLLYESLAIDHYVRKHNFELWKRTTMHSYSARRKASKEIRLLASRIPSLQRHSQRTYRVTVSALTVWTIIFFIVSFIMLVLALTNGQDGQS